MFEKIDRITKVSTKTLAEIAGWIMFLCMSLITLNIILRTIFKKPILGTYEWVGILSALTISLGLSYCAYVGGHIAIDFIVEKFHKKVKKTLSIIYCGFSTVFMAAVTVAIYNYAIRLAISGEVSPTTKIPFYIFVFIVAFGFLAMVLVLFLDLIKNIRRNSNEF